jgi:hypothetical protein
LSDAQTLISNAKASNVRVSPPYMPRSTDIKLANSLCPH